MNPAPRTLHHIELALTLRAPWLVHGNDPGSHGLDAVQLRGPDGRRVLPGTLLAGRIRAAWRELGTRFGLQDVPQELAWFGPLAEADKADDGIATPAGAGKHRRQPLRARVHVSDLLEGALPRGAGNIATRVEINEASGAASDGMLLALEQLDLPGEEVTVYGLWHAWLALGEAEPLARHIAKALRWQTQLGAQRSVGFGELVDVKVQLLANAADNGSAAQLDAFVGGDKAAARAIRLQFTQPLAVGNQRIQDNLYRSSDIIPGAAIKGALATALRHQRPGQPMPGWFDALRITHALPCAGHQRPAPLPLSLAIGKAADGSARLWDLANSDAPAPLDDKGQALRFQPDWKPMDETLASAGQGWGRTQRHLRVRTAIHDGQAKDGQLFAYDCVVASENGADQGAAGDSGSPAAPAATLTHWSATLDLPAALDRPEAWREVARLLQDSALGPIGKTDAFASVELVAGLGAVWPASTRVTAGAEVCVMLVTPALLFPTSEVLGHTSAGLLGAGPAVDLDQVYRKAFAELAVATPLANRDPAAAPAMALLRHFSRQTLVGGDYLDKRFGRSAQADYLPQVLVNAGSVFVFKVIDAGRAKALLAHWQRHGLPLGESVVRAYSARWDSNPWLPENGYGEVLVNPDTGFVAHPAHPTRTSA